jgi:predicted transcriptional regulator
VEWKRLGIVLASEYRKKIVMALSKGPKTPKQLSEETGILLPHVSSSLKILMQNGIVECLTPKLRKGKLYALTEDGKKILELMSK